ncbi:MAG: hypothetical protein NTU53_01420, partial [Planctomycetota bacterium]|nr:hypothetical protein [Planctomycetota bacterium]
KGEREEGVISGLGVAGYVVGGMLMPVVGLMVGASLSEGVTRWQSGRWCDWAGVLLHWKAGWPFYVLTPYAMGCMLLVLLDWRRFAAMRWVRAGIYLGGVLNIQYAIIAYVVYASVWADWTDLDCIYGLLIGVGELMVTVGMLWVLGRVRRRLGTPWALFVLGAVLSVGVGVGTIVSMHDRSGDVVIWMFVSGLAALPVWPLVAYGMMARLLWRLSVGEEQGGKGMLAGWLAGYGGAWAAAVIGAIEHYNSLPTTRQGFSYIATAAARGHRRFVGARGVDNGWGGVVMLNEQLRVLICAEIAVHVIWPGVGRVFRRVYDVVGPVLARGVVNAWVADAVYVSLKPVEWGARMMLWGWFGDVRGVMGRLYGEDGP